MNRTFDFSIGEYFHGYNRGVDKRIIFLDKQDHERFVKLLYVCNSKNQFDFDDVFVKGQRIELKDIERGDKLVAIGGWCLMPNHYHLLLNLSGGSTSPSLYGSSTSPRLNIANKHFLNYKEVFFVLTDVSPEVQPPPKKISTEAQPLLYGSSTSPKSLRKLNLPQKQILLYGSSTSLRKLNLPQKQILLYGSSTSPRLNIANKHFLNYKEVFFVLTDV